MSTLPASAAAQHSVVVLESKIAAAVAQVGMTVPALAAVIKVRLYDLMSHHRQSILAHNAFPDKRSAQKMLATRLWRYATATGGEAKPLQFEASGFAAAETGETFGPSFFRTVEEGGTINSSKPMAIPTGAAGKMMNGGFVAGPAFARLLAARGFDVAPSGALFTMAGASKDAGARFVLWGMLRRRRQQRPILKFFEQFNSIFGRHMAEIDRDLDAVEKAVGNEAELAAIQEAASMSWNSGRARAEAVRQYLDANPGKYAAAARVGRQAAAAVKRFAKQKGDKV